MLIDSLNYFFCILYLEYLDFILKVGINNRKFQRIYFDYFRLITFKDCYLVFLLSEGLHSLQFFASDQNGQEIINFSLEEYMLWLW